MSPRPQREDIEMREGRLTDRPAPFRPPSPPSPAFEKDPYDRDDSQIALPLVSNAQPQRHHDNFSVDDFDERREFAPSELSRGYGDGGSNVIDSKEKDVLDNVPHDGEITEEYRESSARRRWVALCWLLTFWVPSPLLSWWGGMKRQDVRQAWREKLAINLIIWFICGCTIFVIAILGPLICPTQHVYNSSELASKSFQNDPNNALVAVRGEVFDLVALARTHLTAVPVIPVRSIMQYGGLDASNIFPVQVNALCSGTRGSLSPYVTLDTTNTTDPFSRYHDFRAFTNDSRPDWYQEQMIVMRSRFRKGFMGYSKKDVRNMAGAGRAVGIYRDKVYELSTYIAQNGGGLRAPNGVQLSADDERDRRFMSDQVLQVFTYNSGQDVTTLIDNLGSSLGQDVINWQRDCLRNLFIIGELDTRDSAQCQFSTYILLALSIVMVVIIGFKFIAALHFGSNRAPENHDKFVICQVPCYTEGEESLRRTIDSVVKTKYDDKRKLLLVICDGNIKGFGNDKATPAIVLDILGVDPNSDPEPLSFQSLGEGAKQHNMGKVYAGLYECAGHVVPYLVIVKVGKPTERSKPGNRGKRDSQMVVMHFLNKIHFNAPMNPLELEMYHQIKNVIGVNPSFYEYLFMVDADTTVDTLSVNRLVSAMMHDKKVVGVCGETSLANAKQSIVTMAQVYEYFISHHLAKAFESLFGSITCLPGCFSMYRLRTPDTHKPLFISNIMINDYSENRVDTLHLKNLLHLGEDRYLTTLVLKHFPSYKTKFVRGAFAETVAPDSASVLLSQRRRWINSTVHNLAELVFLDQLCGFCCFSMRFVVFIDLLSTIIAPVTVAYIGYLLYLVIGKGGTIATLSIVMLAAIYGLQALIFIFKMRWDMIAWMIFYILAIPVFSFFLPLYSFWKMDDFSWGTTRLVVGEKGKKIVIHDEGKFDPRSIPLKSWNDYENELWDHESNHSGSYMPPMKAEYDNRSVAASGYGGEYGRPGSIMTNSQGPPGMGYNPHGMTPMASYQDFQAQSRAASLYSAPQVPYGGMGMGMDPMGSPFASNPNFQQPQMSLYQSAPGPGSGYNSFYGGPIPDPRASSYSLSQAQGGRPSSQYPSSRPATQILPETSTDYQPLDMGEAGINDTQLEQSIRRICAEADLDNLTKKGVRKQLEQEFGVGLDSRKATINGIIERVLNE